MRVVGVGISPSASARRNSSSGGTRRESCDALRKQSFINIGLRLRFRESIPTQGSRLIELSPISPIGSHSSGPDGLWLWESGRGIRGIGRGTARGNRLRRTPTTSPTSPTPPTPPTSTPTTPTSPSTTTSIILIMVVISHLRLVTVTVVIVERDIAKMDTRLPPVAILGFEARGLVHLVDFFQRQTFRFVNEEVDEEDTAQAGGAPDKENLGLQVGVAGTVVDEVGGGVGDGPVEHPLLGQEVSGWNEDGEVGELWENNLRS